MDQHQAGMGPANNTMAKTLIPCASTYSIEFADGCDLADLLSKSPFVEPGTLEHYTTGFIPVQGDEYVLTLPGVARVFKVRLADKILPASVVAHAVDKRVAEIEENEIRRVGKKERQTIKECVTDELLARALVKYKNVLVFHHFESGMLVIPSTSANVCDRIMSKLCHAVKTMRTQTIHVSGLTDGLTTRMKEWAQAEDLSTQHPMGIDFAMAGDITLKGELGKAKFSIDDLSNAQKGVNEAMLLGGMEVDEIGLQCSTADYSFRLTSGFKFKGIQPGVAPEQNEELDDETEAFTAQVFAELVPLVGVCQQLSELFGFGDGANDDDSDDAPKIEAA